MIAAVSLLDYGRDIGAGKREEDASGLEMTRLREHLVTTEETTVGAGEYETLMMVYPRLSLPSQNDFNTLTPVTFAHTNQSKPSYLGKSPVCVGLMGW
jgi:hypothetical protein